MSPWAAAAVLLATVVVPFDLPPLPRPDEGYGALFDWLRLVNSQLSIPDTEFRWMFGGISIPILLIMEFTGMRRSWALYPFLVPFWLVFGSVSLGVVGGLAATAAHLLLFPAGRIAVLLRRRGQGEPGPVRADAPAAPAPRAPAAPVPRGAPRINQALFDVLRAVAERSGTTSENARTASGRASAAPGPRPGASKNLRQVLLGVLRALADQARTGLESGRTASGGARAARESPEREAPPVRSELPPEPTGAATGVPPGRPDFSPFRPDLSRFRRPR